MMMLITLTGDNSFSLGRELAGLIDAFTAEHGELAVERLDGQEADFERINQALTGLPFMTDRKLVVLRAPGANRQFVEQIEQIFNNLPDTTDVAVVEPKLDKRLAYYKFLKKQTDFRDFTDLDQNGLIKWLTATAKDRKGVLSPADARYLVERVGSSQQLLSNELDKLLLYDSTISRQAIDLLTDAAPTSSIFELLEAAFAGRRRQTLEFYNQQRAQKVEPAQIIAMLAWQLQVLAVIKAAGERPADQIAKEAKLNPFVVRKSQTIARQRRLAELKRLVSELLKIDLDSKRTGLDADEALQHYLLAIAG